MPPRFWRIRTGAMQDSGFGLRRISLLGTSVNNGKKRGRSPDIGPRPVRDHSFRRACIRASMSVRCVIVVALREFDEYAWLVAYRPRIMTRWQHHDVARPELFLRTVVHHHL